MKASVLRGGGGQDLLTGCFFGASVRMECHGLRARLLKVYVEVLVRGEGKREGVVRITLDLMGGERKVC